MTGVEQPPAEDWRDLLSALLDGELSADEEARVRAELDASADGHEELAELARVRTLVRDLPPVDPPFGFYERLLRDRHRPRHVGLKAGGALVAAAAAIVLVVGFTPATDRVAPPVAAYAARHEQMDPAADGTAPTAEPVAAVAPADDFEPVGSGELDEMGAPVVLTDELHRTSGYQNAEGALHLVYTDGAAVVSVYEQTGEVAWDQLPAGTMVQVDGTPAWAGEDGGEAIVVLERGPTVYTVVARADGHGHDEMMAVAVALPAGPDPSVVDRLRQGCRAVADQFSMGTSDS